MSEEDKPTEAKRSLPVLPELAKLDALMNKPAGCPTAEAGAASPERQKMIQEKVIQALQTVFDPEIPVNIYDLGLIYDILVDANDAVKVRMTLTAPACPVAETLPPEVERKVQSIPEVSTAQVELVWDPPWTREKMSETAKLELGMF